jgi:hypothetical protein
LHDCCTAYIVRLSRRRLRALTAVARQATKIGIMTMMKNFDDFQRMGQASMDSALKVFGEWNRGWQAIATEMGDYTKRSLEDGSATFEKLMGAKSLEQALEIQSNYAKRSYDDYMQQMSKLGAMYADLAKEAAKPMERIMQAQR